MGCVPGQVVHSQPSVDARDRSTGGPSWFFMKGGGDLQTNSLPTAAFSPSSTANPTNKTAVPEALNNNPTTSSRVAANSSDTARTTQAPSTNKVQADNSSHTPPAGPPNSTLDDSKSSPATSPPDVPTPDQAATSTCHSSSSGKNVTFSHRACWYAAKTLAEAGTSAAQCGHCVLGLYDADKKAMFKPPGPIQAAIVEEQAMHLLAQCKSNGPPKLSRRDASSNSSSSTTVNIQLLMGYNEKSKDCPGL
ncbi:hypothetical protein VP01_673g2 [Puccinia sorghi]|uniref:Uncharacterized protein n=1 Tax=Puccinia sorghi TaxID=27349 RepID=A0A0L6UEU4_9BASI|nr:hypothetical protein VP01_673g2 [Puccinia sorghi]